MTPPRMPVTGASRLPDPPPVRPPVRPPTVPFQVHSAGDYLAAALLLAAPFTLHFRQSDSGLTALYLAAGIAVLAVSLITNYQYRPGTVSAIPTSERSRSAA